MLDALSRSIAEKIKEADPDGPVSVEVMEYSLAKRLNYIVTFLLTIIFGALSGGIVEPLISLYSFLIIRKASGGVHLKSLTACAIVSALIFCIIPHIEVGHVETLVITGLSAVIYAIYSPNNTEELNPSRLTPYLKLLSVIICLSNFYFQMQIVALTFAIQALLILPWKGVIQDETKNS